MGVPRVKKYFTLKKESSSSSARKAGLLGKSPVKALSDDYILRKLAERPDRISFGPRTRKTFRELLRYREEKRRIKSEKVLN